MNNPFGNFPFYFILTNDQAKSFGSESMNKPPETYSAPMAYSPSNPFVNNQKNSTRYSTPPTRVSEKIPKELLKLPVKCFKTGDEGWISIFALAFEDDGSGWLDSEERPSHHCSQSTPVYIKKDECGFIVDLSKIPNEIICELPLIDKSDTHHNREESRESSIIEAMTGRKMRKYDEPVIKFIYNL